MTAPKLRIGRTDIVGVSDGALRTSLDVVNGLDRTEVSRLAGSRDEVYIPVNNFLIESGTHRILIDAGSGSNMQSTVGLLPEHLRAADIEPQTITHILLTHLHPDHANGLIDGLGKPHFPNAELVVHSIEAEFWLRPADRPESDMVARNRTQSKLNVAPYLDKLRRVRDKESLLGFTPFLMPGHTPGHTCWRFDENDQTFFFWGDIVHLPAIQIRHPGASVAYDLDPVAAEKSRREILDMATTDKVFIAGAHMEAPGFGHVVRRGREFTFESL